MTHPTAAWSAHPRQSSCTRRTSGPLVEAAVALSPLAIICDRRSCATAMASDAASTSSTVTSGRPNRFGVVVCAESKARDMSATPPLQAHTHAYRLRQMQNPAHDPWFLLHHHSMSLCSGGRCSPSITIVADDHPQHRHTSYRECSTRLPEEVPGRGMAAAVDGRTRSGDTSRTRMWRYALLPSPPRSPRLREEVERRLSVKPEMS
jgi:hypothetical protein